MNWKRRLLPFAKELAYQLHVDRGFFLRYPYMFSPMQLSLLCEYITNSQRVEGAVVEVGCALGDTTVFLNEHMTRSGIDKRYVCVDTFSGFTDRDVDHEIQQRGKRRVRAFDAFRSNKRKWVERTLAVNDIARVTVHESDAVSFDFSAVAPIAFCLIDVDLYLPVKSTLSRVFDLMPVGGVIVVDDCMQRPNVWDGAHQAYREFTTERELEHRVVLDKIGVVERE